MSSSHLDSRYAYEQVYRPTDFTNNEYRTVNHGLDINDYAPHHNHFSLNYFWGSSCKNPTNLPDHPVALEMLHKERLFLNPHVEDVDCATFWDSLEHIQDIAGLLSHVKQFAFVSIPIFRDLAHARNSKHFRPDEHCWYYTDDGFKRFMYAHGFTVIGQSTFETDLGREDIGTYTLCKLEN